MVCQRKRIQPSTHPYTIDERVSGAVYEQVLVLTDAAGCIERCDLSRADDSTGCR
ncbi:Hypothetical protein A7982_02308 [Minicystis rosea]|nr:Hypothetical protein A7982_02308 [Minicystis rosea]